VLGKVLEIKVFDRSAVLDVAEGQAEDQDTIARSTELIWQIEGFLGSLFNSITSMGSRGTIVVLRIWLHFEFVACAGDFELLKSLEDNLAFGTVLPSLGQFSTLFSNVELLCCSHLQKINSQSSYKYNTGNQSSFKVIANANAPIDLSSGKTSGYSGGPLPVPTVSGLAFVGWEICSAKVPGFFFGMRKPKIISITTK